MIHNNTLAILVALVSLVALAAVCIVVVYAIHHDTKIRSTIKNAKGDRLEIETFPDSKGGAQATKPKKKRRARKAKPPATPQRLGGQLPQNAQDNDVPNQVPN